MGGLDSIQVMAEYTAAIARFLQGDLHDSADALERALSLPGMRYPVWRIYTLGSLALIRAWAGHDTDALQLAEAAIDAAHALDLTAHPGVTHAHMAAALVHLDRLDPDDAAAQLARSDLQNQRRTSSVVYFDFQRSLAARLARAHRRSRRRTRHPASTRRLRPRTGPPRRGQPRPPRAAPHRPRPARRSQRAPRQHAPTRPSRRQPESTSRSPSATSPTPAPTSTAGTHPTTTSDRALAICSGRAAVADAEGDQRAAKDALRTAVARAEAEQLRWPFLEVPAALRLLQRSPQHHSRLIDDALIRAAKTLDRGASAQASLIEPLTERELAVLEYLPGRLKNQEIAAELYVSVNTLKSHLRNIYRKLEVADRDEAVAKATDIGLL